MIGFAEKRSNLLVGLAICAAAAGGAVAAASPVAAFGLLAVTAIGALLFLPAAGIPLLIGVASLNRLALSAGGSQIRLELGLVLILGLVVANRLAVRTLSWRSMFSPVLPWLLLYTACNIFSTVLFADEKVRGLKLDAEIVAACLAYMVVLGLCQNRADLRRAISILWFVTVAEATLGILFVALYVAHVGSYGVQLGDFGLPMAYGTQWEANIFGSYLLGNFFLLLGDYVSGKRDIGYTVGLIVVLAGILLSMTRTVWLALLVGLFVFALCMARRGMTVGRLKLLLAIIPVLALAGLVLGASTPFAGRLLDVVNLGSSSASGRFTIFNDALADWHSNAIFGLGTGSFNVGASPGQPHPWLPNLLLLTLHDTGIIGIAALVLLAVAFFTSATRALRFAGDLGPFVAGSIAAITALLIAFQTTSGFWFLYTWIVFGLASAAVRWQSQSR